MIALLAFIKKKRWLLSTNFDRKINLSCLKLCLNLFSLKKIAFMSCNFAVDIFIITKAVRNLIFFFVFCDVM